MRDTVYFTLPFIPYLCLQLYKNMLLVNQIVYELLQESVLAIKNYNLFPNHSVHIYLSSH